MNPGGKEIPNRLKFLTVESIYVLPGGSRANRRLRIQNETTDGSYRGERMSPVTAFFFYEGQDVGHKGSSAGACRMPSGRAKAGKECRMGADQRSVKEIENQFRYHWDGVVQKLLCF